MKRLTLTLAAAAAGFAGAPAAAQTVLTLNSWVPPNHSLTVTQIEWCELVSKNSGGKIRCNPLPRAATAPPGTYDAVKNGVVDVSFTVHGYTPGRFVLPKITEFPFLGDSAEATSVAFHRIASKYPEFGAEHRDVHVLAYFTHGPGITFNTKKAVTAIEDLQGLKWRVGGGIVNDIAKVVGMNVTLKPAPESYELLSGGVMDGTLFPAESIESFRIDKIIKHATTFPGGLYNTSFVFMMNKAKYDRLSPDEKKAVDAASGEFAARMIGRSWDKADRRAFALMQANNIHVTKADAKFVNDLKARTSKLEQDWARDAEAKGLKNAAKVLAELRAEIAKVSR
jgi:TRAP-type transport system periplasmic protein